MEVSPQASLTYGPYHEASILTALEYQYLYCFSYKILGEKKIYSHALPDYELHKKEPHNDRMLAGELYKVLNKHDIVICHNVRFDVPMAKARFIYHKFPPMRPIKGVCTLQMARKVAKFPSNTLKELALFLGIKHKMETSKGLGEALYRFPYDFKKWKEMRLYNKIDSEVCEQAFNILSSWESKVAPMYFGAFCQNPMCLSENIRFKGLSHSKTPTRQFVCQECGRWGNVKI